MITQFLAKYVDLIHSFLVPFDEILDIINNEVPKRIDDGVLDIQASSKVVVNESQRVMDVKRDISASIFLLEHVPLSINPQATSFIDVAQTKSNY